MSSEMNPVRLQAEVIDLRDQLATSRSRVEKMFMLITQCAPHDEVAVLLKDEKDDFFETLTRRVAAAEGARGKASKSGASSDFKGGKFVAMDEYDKLEKDFFDGLDREKEYCERIELLEGAASVLKAELAGRDEAEKRARAEQEKRLRDELTAQFRASGSDARDETAALKHKLHALEQQHTAEVADLTARLEAAQEQAAGAVSEAQMEEEVARRVEEGVFSVTIDLEDQIAALKEENAALQGSGGAAADAAAAERDAALAERDEARAALADAKQEVKVANRVKSGALDEASEARSSLEAERAKAASLREELEAAQAQRQTTADMSRELDLEETVAKQRAQIAQLTAQLQQLTAATVSDKQRADEATDKLRKVIVKFKETEDARADAELRVSALQQRVAALSRERDSAAAARDAAFAAGEQRAQAQEREKGETERRYKQQLARLQEKFKDDHATVKQVYDGARKTYEALIEKLQQVGDPQEKEDLICEVLFQYERRIWHLNNEVQNVQTIVNLKEEDQSLEMARQLENLLSSMEILRMQLRDANIQPQV